MTVLVALVSEVFVASVQEAASAFGMTQAFVGFIIVSIVGAAAEMASAFSGARKNRLDLSVGIALGSASQIALFVAPVLVLLSYVLGPTPMTLQFWPGAVVMMLIATLTAALVTNSGRSAWFVGVLVLTALRSGPCRYSEIKRAVRGISDRRLAGTLRDFVRDGLAERRVLSTIPSHVEYELTPLGQEVSDSVSTFVVDIMRLAPRVAAARAKS